MKRLFFIVFLIITFFTVTIYSKNQIPTQEPENMVEIAHKEIFKRLEYGKVLFEHQKHIDTMAKHLNKPKEITCGECHLRDKYGDYSFDFQGSGNIKSSEELKNLYHMRCLNCHQTLSSQNKKTGPEILSCRDCHKKESEKVEVKYPLFEFDFSLHEKHVKKHEKDCSLCHHIYDIEEKDKSLALVYEKGTEQSCYYCHDFTKKRGPEISKIVKVAKEKNLDIKNANHLLCLNCHLKNRLQAKDAGPLECKKCHTGKYKTIEELKDVPRPERDQPDKVFLNIEEGKMKGVAFKHSFHEKNNRNCRVCHHETLRACRDCHNLKGKEEGGFVNALTAFHSLNSETSCQGCHKNFTRKEECYGCHYFIPPVKAEVGKGQTCSRCHTGKKEPEVVKTFALSSDKIKNEVTIKHIEKEFEPVKIPHYKMIKKLTDISNQSKIATYFHKDIDTICRGCHHKSKEDAESQRERPPLCVNCHSVTFDEKAIARPRLQAAYHSMCIKCHETIKLEKPKKCEDCHKRKVAENVYN